MNFHRKNKANYDRVMSRVFNRSRTSLRSSSNVTRHEVPSSVRVGAKPSVSAVSSSVFSELPTVLNDYVPESDGDKVVKRSFVKPRKTLKSLDPSKAKAPSRPPRGPDRNIRPRSSVPAMLSNNREEWSESHVRQCYSSRSHTRLKELRDEIKAFRETDKLLKIRSQLYKRCGVVLDDVGNVAQDKAVQADLVPDKENTCLRCRQWICAAGRTDLESKDMKTLHNSYRICDLHFVSSDHLKRNLKHNAVPSLNLPQLENDDKLSKYTQTDVESKCCTLDIKINTPSTSKVNNIGTQTAHELYNNTPRKRKLRKQLTYEHKRIKMLEDQLQISEDEEPELSPIVQKIIKIQKYYRRSFRGNRYDREYKMFAMNIYFASPLAYRIFAKTLYLPNERTLRRTNIDIGTSFSENVIRCLQSKVKNLSESEKVCVLCADEMSLKRHLHYQINKDQIIGFHEIDGIQKREPATQAFVVMARGLFSKWKQPLAYCFLSQSKNYPELDAWLDNIIMKVLDIGFDVVAFTSDQGSNFINMAKGKNITEEKTFFYVNGKKIYYIFDVPHLLNSLRNNLIMYDFIYHDSDGKEQTASWEDVQNLYNKEKERSYQMAFKLTESHINPNNFEKKKVKLAAQVLSRCVATAMQCSVELDKLPKKALGTAKFIQLINDTFDILNSSSCNETYKYKKSFSQQGDQMKVLQQVLHFLKDVRIVNKSNGKNVTNTLKCLKSLEITIQSVIKLSTDLRRLNYKSIFTRRLDQDVLENFFGNIKQQGGNRREPIPVQFAAAFRKLFLINIIRHSEFANCAEDIDQLLVTVEESSKMVQLPENESEDVNVLTVGTVDYRFDLPEENAFSYVCGYLLRKCKEVHKNCKLMDEYVNYKGEVNVTNTLINMRAFDTAQPFGSLCNAQTDFKDYVRQMDEIITTIFKGPDKLPLHVGNEILKNIEQITLFNMPCECFPIEYLKKLFIRFRIFNILKHNVRNFKDKSLRKKFFSVSQL